MERSIQFRTVFEAGCRCTALCRRDSQVAHPSPLALALNYSVERRILGLGILEAWQAAKAEGEKMSTEKRLEQLDKQVRRFKLAGAVVLILGISQITTTRTALKQVVDENEFILKTVIARLRGRLRVDHDGALLALYNRSSNPRLILQAGSNVTENACAQLSVTSDGPNPDAL